ncbi:MAG: hypothetical protein KatS3mg089_0696 [Patescibacteria group bacterium]|nr:MAG: hypothetical protein KatS3mg089_0696 [Patescibacteria group bacterium]
MSENREILESDTHNRLRGPQNEDLRPTLGQKINDRVVDADLRKITRRAFLAAGILGVLRLLRRNRGENKHPNLSQPVPTAVPTESHPEVFHLKTIDAPIDPQISFQQLKKEGIEFVADTESGDLTVTDIPDVEIMELADIKGKIIVRRGASSNNEGIELTLSELKKINPEGKYKVVRIIGGEYAPGFSHLGSTYVANSAENTAHGIWYAIVNEKLDPEKGIKKYFFADLYGKELPSSENPLCVSANFGTIIKDTKDNPQSPNS